MTLGASLVLLCASATLSGCETSLFSLGIPDLNRLRAGTGRTDRIINELHSDLKSLLPTLLFCNMAVNVLIYALSGAVAADLGQHYGSGATFLYSMVSLLVVVFFGEVFPKQFAIASSMFFARLTCLPVWLLFRAVGKPMKFLNYLVNALERVLVTERPNVARLREEELRLMVELSKNDGIISRGEYELLDGVVDLPEVRLRDIMVPRVDIASLKADADFADALATTRQSGHCKLPVLDPRQDDLAGWIDVRDIYAGNQAKKISDHAKVSPFLRDFRFFSEHDQADQVLEQIKGEIGGDLYAVVDERGQCTGFFTTQDIMDEILGHFGEDGGPPPTEIREADGRYYLSGRLSIREWREMFPVPGTIPRGVTTVGGLVAALLGRMARPGDTVTIENMEMTVVATWHHRATEVALRLVDQDPGESDAEEDHP